jgi:hypothetical protein
LLAGQPATKLPPSVSNAATTKQAPADGISSSPITALASRCSSAAGQDDPRAQFAWIAAKENRTPAPEYFIALATPTFITFPFESSLCSLYRATTWMAPQSYKDFGADELPLAP